MKTRDRKRRPRGGPNPGRLRATNEARFWVSHLIYCYAATKKAKILPFALARARHFTTPRERRYVRIRLKEARHR